jgi:prolipoprotein diacylglyceryltransferase
MIKLVPHPEWHGLFEALGYAASFGFYRWERQKSGDFLNDQRRWIVIFAAAIGALIGSRILGLLEESPDTSLTFAQLIAPTGGKTVVGGLLGGWLMVEIAKKLTGIHQRTGDLFAIPLCIGIAVGRLGCFFAGIDDHTFGLPTSLPWGVDFGDGLARHPTQAYEILFVSALAVGLHYVGKRPHAEGFLFRCLMAAYLAWRVAVDFLKPDPTVFGMNLIQWSCVLGLIAVAFSFRRPKHA